MYKKAICCLIIVFSFFSLSIIECMDSPPVSLGAIRRALDDVLSPKLDEIRVAVEALQQKIDNDLESDEIERMKRQLGEMLGNLMRLVEPIDADTETILETNCWSIEQMQWDMDGIQQKLIQLVAQLDEERGKMFEVNDRPGIIKLRKVKRLMDHIRANLNWLIEQRRSNGARVVTIEGWPGSGAINEMQRQMNEIRSKLVPLVKQTDRNRERLLEINKLFKTVRDMQCFLIDLPKNANSAHPVLSPQLSMVG